MKQTLLLRWIEAAEARSVCLLAEEDPMRARINPMPPDTRPFKLARLQRQLCLGKAVRCLSRLGALSLVNSRARMRLC